MLDGRKSPLLQHAKHALWQPQVSPDGKWIVFIEIEPAGQSIHVTPFHPGIQEKEWVTPIPTGPENDKPRWSPDGRMLYFTSTRDGHRCVWSQRLNANRTGAGVPFAVMHFHSAVRSPSNVSLYELETSVSPGRLVLVLGERGGNIWTTAAASSEPKSRP